MLTYSDGAAPGSSLYVSYSTSGLVQGPYTSPSILFSPQYDSTDCGAGTPADFAQAHWEYYGIDSDTLLVSWVSCSSYISFGNVTFLH